MSQESIIVIGHGRRLQLMVFRSCKSGVSLWWGFSRISQRSAVFFSSSRKLKSTRRCPQLLPMESQKKGRFRGSRVVPCSRNQACVSNPPTQAYSYSILGFYDTSWPKSNCFYFFYFLGGKNKLNLWAGWRWWGEAGGSNLNQRTFWDRWS